MKPLQTPQWYVFKTSIKFLKVPQKTIKVNSDTAQHSSLTEPKKNFNERPEGQQGPVTTGDVPAPTCTINSFMYLSLI